MKIKIVSIVEIGFILLVFCLTIINVCGRGTRSLPFSFGTTTDGHFFVTQKYNQYTAFHSIIYAPAGENVLQIASLSLNDPQGYKVGDRRAFTSEILGEVIFKSKTFGIILNFIKSKLGLLLVYFIPISIIYITEYIHWRVIFAYIRLKNKKEGKYNSPPF